MPYKDKTNPDVQEKLRAYRRKWYANNKTHAKEKLKSNRAQIKEWFDELKQGLSCKQCSENHPACLDFHHKDSNSKEINVSLAVHECWSKERIMKEIEKCEVLCSNCHRKLHYEQIRR